jgi:3-dehydroquinate synthetase
MKRTVLESPPLPPGRPNLILTGFSATGKTTVGPVAAAALGLPFIDLDNLLEARAGRSIQEIFAGSGEANFRQMERVAVGEAARLSGTVIAVGGGAVMDQAGFGQLAEGAVVAVLNCNLEDLLPRLARSHQRPLLGGADEDSVRALLVERAGVYAAAGVQIDTTGRTVEEVAADLVSCYRGRVASGPVVVRVSAGPTSYPVVVGPGAISTLGQVVETELPRVRRAVVISDEMVAAGAGAAAATSLRDAGLELWELTTPAGEASKRIDMVADLWQHLTRLGLDRQDVVVAVGGGAALDAIGFAAATFARGMLLVNVPTTLLSMADAAVGGKVAIDHGGSKNSVGSFHQPSLVLADPELLSTLPDEVMRQGMAEILKGAVLASPMILDVCQEYRGRGPWADGGWLAEQAVRVKAAYVESDPDDRSVRQALNLGHTFAHGLEAASDYVISHGDAVAVGVVAAADLGRRLNISAPELGSRLAGLLALFGLPTTAPAGLDPVRVRQALMTDKKRRSGESVFVIPRDGGGAELITGLNLDYALASLWEPGLPANDWAPDRVAAGEGLRG